MKSGENMNLEDRHIFGAHGNYRIDQVNLPKNEVAVSFSGITKRYRIYKNDGQKFVMLFSKKLRRSIPLDTHLGNVGIKILKGEYINLCGNYADPRNAIIDLLKGVVYPDFGRLWINGTVASVKALKDNFSGYLSAYENIKRMSRIRRMKKPEINEFINLILDFAEMPRGKSKLPLDKLTPKTVSRLKAAYILHANYDILIMDAQLPKSSNEFTKKCDEKLKEMLRTKTVTVIYPTGAPSSSKFVTGTLLFGKTRPIYDGDYSRARDIFDKREAKLIALEKNGE
jgi:ABC-type polysaccharide/polyol phosphate transport system ATPase subunit